MSDVKRLIVGIILVGIGIATVLGGSGGPILYIGAALGIIGSGLVLTALVRGKF
ncbi:hypothetical protein H7097_00010 [Aeromicrobium sp.]|nr:hypothetical protein [Candidatus Saccharibacteria bacterium]